QMQVATRFVGKALEKFLRQTEPKSRRHVLPLFRSGDFSVGQLIHPAPDQTWPTAEINDTPRQTFIHRHIGFPGERVPWFELKAVTANALLVAQGLQKRLPQRNSAIFHRVMSIHLEVSFATHV